MSLMLSVANMLNMVSVIMLNVIMLCVIMLSVIMLSVVMLSVVILSVVMLNVVAPFKAFWPTAEVEPMSNSLVHEIQSVQ
jgi:hypothetical protein